MSRDAPFALLDTGVYLQSWLDASRWVAFEDVLRPFIVRSSSIVLSELRRGALTAAARRRVKQLRRSAAHIWTPTEGDWWEAGSVLARLGREHGFDAAGKRRIQNDVLMGLVARRHGAVLVTTDRADFERIRRLVRGLRVTFV